MVKNLLLLDVWNGEVKEITIKEFEDYYKYLRCDCFDIPTRRIGKEKREFDIFCDDEGLLKFHIPTAYNSKNQTMLVGNLIFSKTDSEGETISLTPEEIEYIKGYIKKVKIPESNHLFNELGIKNYVYLTECDY